MTSLLKKLQTYADSGVCPMHMPGHKRCDLLSGDLPFKLDISEIDGFDNLHQCEGVLANLSKKCADLYGSDTAYPLINGSSCGILAAVRAAVRFGDTVIVARNCHKSVYHALELNHLKPVYLIPPIDPGFGINGSITPAQMAEALSDHPEATLVILTSPTYEGVISPVREIAAIVHDHHIPLLIDEAHGAHLGLHPGLPEEAVACGADLVVMSLHKTLPALTQTALLHLSGDYIRPQAIERALAIFETSSPSYVLLASIDYCIRLLQRQRQELFEAYLNRLAKMDRRLRSLSHLAVLAHGEDRLEAHPAIVAFDPGKLVISTHNTTMSGRELAAALRNTYRIETEMTYGDYLIAMTSICDSDENFSALTQALLEIDATLTHVPAKKTFSLPAMPLIALSCADALNREDEGRKISFFASAEKISLEYLWAYPPGIPLIVPGEIISPETIESINCLLDSGVKLYCDHGKFSRSIRTLNQPKND